MKEKKAEAETVRLLIRPLSRLYSVRGAVGVWERCMLGSGSTGLCQQEAAWRDVTMGNEGGPGPGEAA